MSDKKTPLQAEAPVGEPPKQYKRRVSPAMREVIRIMAEEGASLPIAANKAKMTRDAAVRAFNRPHVKALYNSMIKEIRENAAQQAYMRINHLSETAESENVRLDSSKWIAGVDGLAPIRKLEGRFAHSHQFKGFDYANPKDVTPTDDSASRGVDENIIDSQAVSDELDRDD